MASLTYQWARVFLLLLLCLFLVLTTHPADAQWAENGVLVPLSGGHSSAIVKDGVGGTFIVYQTSSTSDLNVQRVNRFGQFLWPADGVPLTSDGTGKDHIVSAIADGAGGSITAWTDFRRDPTEWLEYNAYAQRFDADGNALWDSMGVMLGLDNWSTTTSYNAHLCSDGAGGAFAIWWDTRDNGWGIMDVYAQRIDANGVRVGPPGGVLLTQDTIWTNPCGIVPDGAGGAYVAWYAMEYGTQTDSIAEVRVQRLDSDLSELWASGGIVVDAQIWGRPTVPPYLNVQIVTDDSGALFVNWPQKHRGETRVLRSQKYDPAGTPLWTTRGIELFHTSPVTINYHGLNYWDSSPDPVEAVPDGAGGLVAIVRTNESIDEITGDTLAAEVRINRVDASGTHLWEPGGGYFQGITVVEEGNAPRLIGDGEGGYFVCWNMPTIYPSDIETFGRLYDNSGDLVWADTAYAGIHTNSTGSGPMYEVTYDGSGGAVLVLGYPTLYAQRIDFDTGTWGTPTGIGIPDSRDRSGLWLSRPTPNPFYEGTELLIHVPLSGDVFMSLHDIRGREIFSERQRFARGTHTLTLDRDAGSGDGLSSGVYFLNVTANGAKASRRIVLVR